MIKSNEESKELLFTERESNFKERTGKDFNFFYNKYYPKLLYFTSRMAESAKLDVTMAQDASTDAFLTAFDKIDKYNQEQSQFSTWLFTIAKNIMLQIIKNEQKTLSMDIPVDEDGTTMKDFIEYSESEQHVHDLVQMKYDIMINKISELKNPYKEVIEMRELKKMAYKDISDNLGRNLSTIKSQIRQGRALLIKETKREFDILDQMYK
jgi:RNA polymerase sigma factor (sigma-70 family)